MKVCILAALQTWSDFYLPLKLLTFAKMNCESMHLAALQTWSDFYLLLKFFIFFFQKPQTIKHVLTSLDPNDLHVPIYIYLATYLPYQTLTCPILPDLKTLPPKIIAGVVGLGDGAG